MIVHGWSPGSGGFDDMGSKGLARGKEGEQPESPRWSSIEAHAAMAHRWDYPVFRGSKLSKNRSSTFDATWASASLIDSAG